MVLDLVSYSNFDLDSMIEYLLDSEGNHYNEYGLFVPKNKTKNRFFQSLIEYLDINRNSINPTKQQLENIYRIFIKLKGYDSYKYYEMVIFSSYDDYLYYNYGDGDKFESIIFEWIEYGLKMSEYHRVYGIIKHNKKHFEVIFSIKILKIMVDYVKRNCRFIINAFKSDNFDKDFKLLYLLFSLLSFRDIIGIDGYHDYKDGIISFFNGVYEVFFSFFLNKQWHGIYNDIEYHNILFQRELKKNKEIYNEEDKEDDPHEGEIKKKCFSFNSDGVLRFFIYLGYPLEIKIKEDVYLQYISLLFELSSQIKITEPLTRNDSYYKTYQYYLSLNRNEGLLSLASITPFIQNKLYNEILSIIYKDQNLFIINRNQFDLKRDFNEVIETLLGVCEFNFQVMVDFLKFFSDNSRGLFNNKKQYFEKYKIIHFVRLFKNVDLSIAIPLISLQCKKLNIDQIDYFQFIPYYLELKSNKMDLKDKLLLSTIFKIEKLMLPLIKCKNKLKKILSFYKYSFQVLRQQNFLQHPEAIYNLFSNIIDDQIKQQFILSKLDLIIMSMDFNYLNKHLVPIYKERITNSFYYKKKEEFCRIPDLIYNKIELPENFIKSVLNLLLNDNSTMQIRKLNLALVCKNFFKFIKNGMNTSILIPIDIGESIYNIKEDNPHKFSLLKPSKVKYLCYSVSNLLDPSLSVLKLFSNLEILEIHGMTKLEANSIAIIDSIKSLQKVIIKSVPFNRFSLFFRGFRDLYGYLKDQYLENENDYEYCKIDLNSFPKQFNIKQQTFDEISKENNGKTFYLHLTNYIGKKDNILNIINMVMMNNIIIQSISTTCSDFLQFYHTSYNMSRAKEFKIIIDKPPIDYLLELFISHPQKNKQESIQSIEFIIDSTLKLKYVLPLLNIFKRSYFLEKFSLTLVYDVLGTKLEQDNNTPFICDEKQCDWEIQNTLNQIFSYFTNNNQFLNFKLIQISDQCNSTININWRDIDISNYLFKSRFPYKFIYFDKIIKFN